MRGVARVVPTRVTSKQEVNPSNPSGNRLFSHGGQKGCFPQSRKWMNLMPEKFASVLVTRVYPVKRPYLSFPRLSSDAAFYFFRIKN
jgi:hypothetical protein